MGITPYCSNSEGMGGGSGAPNGRARNTTTRSELPMAVMHRLLLESRPRCLGDPLA